MSQSNYGGTNFQTQTGKDNTNFLGGEHRHYYPQQATPSTGIPKNLRPSSVVEFVGREKDLERLHEQLQQSDRIAVTAVRGMGGIGKTELALQYAWTHYDRKTYEGGVCWVRAVEDVGLQIVGFARSLLGLNLPEQLETLSERVAYCWQHWREGDVLLVFDDVSDYKEIDRYLLGLDRRFKVLLTTRSQLGAGILTLPLDVLDERSGLDLLRSLVTAERIDSQLDDAQKLCEWLGYLPLGLELVGRYLARKPDLSLAQMRQRLEQQKLAARALVKAESDMTAKLGVAAAFELSWQELDAQAQQLGQLLSLFALAPIHWNLVEQCWASADSETLEDLRDEGLLKLHLLQKLQKVEAVFYQLHPLIREFFLAKLEETETATDIKQAVCTVMAKAARQMPSTPLRQEIEKFKPIVPHLQEIATTQIDYLSDEDLIWALVGVARFYKGQGLYQQAEPWYRECLNATQTRFGQDDRLVADSLNNLAGLYRLQGRYEEAEPLYLRSLEIREQQLGANHPDVAASLNNLATLYESQGRYGEAEPLYLRSLEICEQQLGANHPDVAQSLNNLAGLYESQGRYEEAEPLYLRSLEIREQQLGANHPDVATSLNNLALLYRSQGRYEEAEPLYLRSLEIWEQQLGANHPDVAQSLNNLALLYRSQGRYEEAEPLYLRSLEIRQQRLGANHPDVAQSLNNLAELYRVQGRYEEAEPLYLRSLEIRQQRLGTNHPNVATGLNNLAELYRLQGRYGEAKPFYLRSLEIWEQQLGANHPNVAASLNNLAELYRLQGRYGEAEPLYLRSLEIRQQQLRTNHPDVATSLNNLALLYHLQGRYGEAQPLYLRSLEIYEQQLGANHPNTITTRQNLEILRQQMNSQS
ncbi:MAG: tetratricopeptide repeat protein [Cyanosarcina radialis HA8281-LM2]|jgi:tetratricopeptide (TPR) repeat protein|nr:tetratricopeptide repeat protein [Cyanosarcina radialis HA8281-LM2]